MTSFTEVAMNSSRSLPVVVLGVALFVTGCDSGKVGTLDQIKKSGEIRLGYRTDAPPLSFNDTSGKPAGYSVELCERIAAAVKDHLQLKDMKTTLVPLTSENRIDAIVNNRADILCGATTITLSRAEKVDFTLMTFVTGGGLLTLANSGIDSLANLAGKSVAVVTGTTSQTALQQYLQKNLIDAKVVVVSDRSEGMKQLQDRKVDAFASDQIVLIGEILTASDPRAYRLGGDLFSFEPYALVVRRDDADFRLVVNRAIAQVYRSGQIEDVFNRWFGQVGVQATPVLRTMYLLQTLPE
jgi:ABC-type amino acid transport substrate-binding protein